MVIMDTAMDTMVFTSVQLSHHMDTLTMVMDMDIMVSAMVIMDTATDTMDLAMDTMVFTSVPLSHHMDILIMVMVMDMDTMDTAMDTMDMVTPMLLSAVTTKLFIL